MSYWPEHSDEIDLRMDEQREGSRSSEKVEDHDEEDEEDRIRPSV